MSRRSILVQLAGTAVLALAVLTIGISAQPNTPAPPLPIHLTCFAVNMSNIGPGAAGMVDITIKQWSSSAERQRFLKAVVEKGNDGLMDLMKDAPAKGRLRFPNWQGPDPHYARLGWDLRYAWHTPLPEGGTRIVLGYDRYIGFWEVRDQPRSVDYPYTLIEIHLNKDGQGEGKMAVATKISFDKKKNTMELENYSSEPVRLTTVKMEKD